MREEVIESSTRVVFEEFLTEIDCEPRTRLKRSRDEVSFRFAPLAILKQPVPFLESLYQDPLPVAGPALTEAPASNPL